MENIKTNETPKFYHMINIQSPDDVRIIFERFFNAVKNVEHGQSILLPISNDVAILCHGPWKSSSNDNVTSLVSDDNLVS